MTQLRKMFLTDESSGLTANLTRTGLDIYIQDQHTKIFDVFFAQTLNITTLDSDATINEYSMEVTTGHGIQVGEEVGLFDSAGQRVYIGHALTAGTNTLTLDTPLNYSYASATPEVHRRVHNLDVNGAVTRQTFTVTNPLDQELDITRIMFQMITTDLPELDMFGDIAGGLTRGVVFRVINGDQVNVFNAKTNGELANLMYDITFYEAAKQGSNGLAGRMTFAGQDKHGVTIRLEQDQQLEVIIQDDLTNLLLFQIMAVGHLVE